MSARQDGAPRFDRDEAMALLRHVVGEETFQRRQAGINGFNQEIRRLGEDYCFGEIWTRPGLPPKLRSIACIGMLIGLNRGAELRIHIGGALNNGCTVEEIKEVLLQSVIYCGLPACNDAFRIAEDVLRERGIDLGMATPGS
ncbi:4-carboxymuconolactone decarboxylase [Sphingobium amiense]|uniref:4-carboxymuconolactone decarboxylase n=1 Tax=Sphingobium amiense TaxID=135719 RepID=A0A494W5G6_9SPHN|nr:carboxymuconolactone decarboxylase family protein [Sphingobium amiense]BBD98408.1 4-carboxymuconolactone decarboxylase [Sphingobium amiense]